VELCQFLVTVTKIEMTHPPPPSEIIKHHMIKCTDMPLLKNKKTHSGLFIIYHNK